MKLLDAKIVAFALLIVVLGIVGLSWPWLQEITSPEPPNFPLPDRPSIAVLPFENLSDDNSQEYFADGITDDLITDLSKVSGLFVIARNSVFSYKGKVVAPQQVAAELGVRYVLEGSVRRAGDQIRINAQLIDATTGGHLWADRYDGELRDVFGLQDAVTSEIVTMLSVQLNPNEASQMKRSETTAMEAYDAFLKGWEQFLQVTPESLRAAIENFEHAVRLDPDYGRAHAALAASYWQIFRRFYHADFQFQTIHHARVRAENLLARAQRTPTALGHQVATEMLSFQGRHTEAIAEGGKAIGIDPNDADSYVSLAGALSLAGNPEEARKLIKKAMRLNPRFPPHYLYQLGLAEFTSGNFGAAAEALERATAINPHDRWSSRLLLATYGHLQRSADAEELLDRVSRSFRGFDPMTITAALYWYPFRLPSDSARLIDGLRAAHVPE